MDRLRAALETIDFEARENKQTDRAFRMTLRRIVSNALRTDTAQKQPSPTETEGEQTASGGGTGAY